MEDLKLLLRHEMVVLGTRNIPPVAPDSSQALMRLDRVPADALTPESFAARRHLVSCPRACEVSRYVATNTPAAIDIMKTLRIIDM